MHVHVRVWGDVQRDAEEAHAEREEDEAGERRPPPGRHGGACCVVGLWGH